jgi:predicted nucleotidyltransferase
VASVIFSLKHRDGIMTKQMPIEFPKEEIEEFCKKHYIRKLSLFGSALRDDFTSESDLDILVEFDPAHIPGLIRLAGMELELGEILGRKIDMRTAQDLSRYFREDVLSSAKVQYAEG